MVFEVLFFGNPTLNLSYPNSATPGKFARFCFVVQPLAASDLPDEDTELPDTRTHILTSLYKKVDALPKLEMEFDRDAKKLFATFYRAIEKQRVIEPRQGTRAMLGKMPEKVGKMAAIIHTINCVVNGVEVDLLIPKSAVEAAIKFVKFTSDQVVSLYTEFSDRTALAPNLMNILQAAEQRGGAISTRHVQKNLFRSSQRPTAQTVREWFSELQQMKHGEVITIKNSVVFNLSPSSPVPPVPPVALNPDRERLQQSPSSLKPVPPVPPLNNGTGRQWGNTGGTAVPQSEPLPNKALDTTGGTGGQNLPPSEKSESLLLSYTTEPEEFAEQIRKAIANLDQALAGEVSKALKGKIELRKEVRAVLTVDEFDNFRLLVIRGFIKGTRVKYVGTRYYDQLQGLELVVNAIDSRSEISCLKPDCRFTTWMKPQELEAIS